MIHGRLLRAELQVPVFKLQSGSPWHVRFNKLGTQIELPIVKSLSTIDKRKAIQFKMKCLNNSPIFIKWSLRVKVHLAIELAAVHLIVGNC